jgi:hypothetical protein
VAAFATEVKVDIENGFGTWKVKLKVNILLCFLAPPRDGRESGMEGIKRVSGNSWVDGDLGSRQRTKIKENEVSRDRRKGRRGLGRVDLTLAIVNVVV